MIRSRGDEEVIYPLAIHTFTGDPFWCMQVPSTDNACRKACPATAIFPIPVHTVHGCPYLWTVLYAPAAGHLDFCRLLPRGLCKTLSLSLLRDQLIIKRWLMGWCMTLARSGLPAGSSRLGRTRRAGPDGMYAGKICPITSGYSGTAVCWESIGIPQSKSTVS